MGYGLENLAGSLESLFRDLLDFVYPPHCGVCEGELRRGDGIVCADCWRSLEAITSPFCQKCGLPLSTPNDLCSACEVRAHLFSFARSYGLFDELFQKIIHLFKYRRKLSLAGPLSALMTQIVEVDRRFFCLEALVPVPLHPVKRRVRGYNQSQLLAQNLSRATGWPLLQGILFRTVNTRSQSKLSLGERATNVRNAFQVRDPGQVRDKRILLVDDVLTTGSTADACSSALLSAGAVQVSVVTVARAVEPEPSSRALNG